MIVSKTTLHPTPNGIDVNSYTILSSTVRRLQTAMEVIKGSQYGCMSLWFKQVLQKLSGLLAYQITRRWLSYNDYTERKTKTKNGVLVDILGDIL